MSKKTDLAIISPSALAQTQELPDFLRDFQGETQVFEQDDVTLPRLSICQDLTPQKKKTNPKYVDGLEVGDFFNAVSGTIYGPEIQMIPLIFSRTRLKYNQPIGSGIDCQSANGRDGGTKYGMQGGHPVACKACRYSQFRSVPGANGSTAPECTEYKNWLVLVAGPDGVEGPMIFSNKSTNLTTLKQFNSVINMPVKGRVLPAFARIFTLATAAITKNGNEFQTWNFRPNGFVPPAYFEAARDFAEGLKDKSIAFNPEDESSVSDAQEQF